MYAHCNKLLICLTLAFALNVQAAEPSKNERFLKSILQLGAVFSIIEGLRSDPSCADNVYQEVDLNAYINLVPETKAKEKKEERMAQIKMIRVMMQTTKLEKSSKTLGQAAYENARETVLRMKEQMGDKSGYCDDLYSMAQGLFQKAQDNLKLAQ